MNRAQKQAFITDLTKNITESKAFALMSFTKLSVEDMTKFRLSLRKQNVRVRVIKNTLARRALEKTDYKEMSDKLSGPLLVAYSTGDPAVTAKAVWQWVEKDKFCVDVQSGVAFGKVLSVEEIAALSKLPGRQELLTQFLWGLKSGPTRFLYALQDAPRRLGYALQALKEKKGKESA